VTDSRTTVEGLTTAIDLVREVVTNGPILRRDLAARLGTSLATLSRLIAPLVEQGVIVGLEPTENSLGRPARRLDVPENGGRYLGVKLRGDSAIGVLTDIRANELATSEVRLDDSRVSTAVGAIAALADKLGHGHSIAGIGVSVGGPVSRASVVDHDRFLDWASVDLGAEVVATLGVPVSVENDVVALTQAEHWFGLGRGLENFAVLTIGVGIGYGLVRESRVTDVHDAGLGLASHIPLGETKRECELGHRGCSSAMLATSSVRAAAIAALGAPLDHDELVEQARSGNAAAIGLVNDTSRALGTLVALVANLAIVDTVIVAGEGISILELGRREFDSAVSAHRNRDARSIDVRIDETGFTSWARGAAVVAIQHGIDSLVHRIN
jgi:predicted NBD/HSP70 family sugar kinase